MTITINGSGTITGATTMASATSFSSTVSAAGNVTLAGAAVKLLNNSGNPVVNQTGAVLQVVQATKTDTFSLSGTTAFTDITGLSVSITPSSSSNKILVFFNAQLDTNGYCDIRLLRGSTSIAQGDAAGSRTQSTTHMNNVSYSLQITYSICWLDSPATTSATTYKLQLGTPYNSAYSAYINRSVNDDNASYEARTASSITVMEIAA